MTCETCRTLLSQGLDLCVRARKLDTQVRTDTYAKLLGGEDMLERYAPRHNALNPHIPVATRCGTPALWVVDQYERDLADWEGRSRHHLMQGCGS